MSAKIKLLIVVIILIILAFLGWLFSGNHEVSVDKEPEIPSYLQNVSYSRITFFHTKGLVASLSIPSYWEGNYRAKEEGNTMKFSCIVNGANVPLFEIYYSETNDKDLALMDLEEYSFFANKNEINFQSDNFCLALVNSLDEVIASFKASKI